jgi:N-acetylmuramoyl-L-alanine amidase
MNDFINYLIQVSALLIILFLPYQLVFRKETRFALNRAYLLTALLIAWIIPVINIPFGATTPELQIFPVNSQIIEPGNPIMEIDQTVQPEDQFSNFNFLMFYWVGAILMLIRNLWIITRILLLSRKCNRYRYEQFQINVREDLPAFTFFNRIFISDTEYQLAGDSLVIRHESAHARQHHTRDLILAELFHTILWFNPFLIIYKKALKETHEYLADQAVLREGIDFEQYALSLQSEVLQSRYQSLVSHFKGSTLKKRISMATKHPNAKSLRKYFLIAPMLLGCLTLWSFIGDPVTVVTPVKAGKNMVVVIDAGHGGKDDGAVTKSGLREKDLNLALALQLDKEPHPGIEFIYTRKTDEFIPIQSRSQLAEKQNADLFISIHLNSSRKTEIHGSDVFFSKKNPKAGISTKVCDRFQSEMGSPVSDQPYVVLWSAACPAVLYSAGYLSNKEEAVYFSDPANQQTFARQLIKTLQAINNQGILEAR